jgi:hypothetical protein
LVIKDSYGLFTNLKRGATRGDGGTTLSFRADVREDLAALLMHDQAAHNRVMTMQRTIKHIADSPTFSVVDAVII